MKEIRFGVVGTGYLSKAHALALKSVARVFDTPLRPVCEMVRATTEAGAAARPAAQDRRWMAL
jgi:predicted dehydrogenase